MITYYIVLEIWRVTDVIVIFHFELFFALLPHPPPPQKKINYLFLTFELIFFNRTRNMKHGRKFHFAGIYLSKFIFRLKFKKSSRFFRIFFQLSNSKLRSLKRMILNFLVYCSIPSISFVCS